MALAVVGSVVTNANGWYVGDNRFEWYWSPGRTLARTASLWDFTRGIGHPRGEFAPVSWAVLALFRGFGASPALSERLWHVTLLLGAGLGVVALLRAWRPSLGPEHVVAGAVYVFNPYSAVFLIPSGLYMNYVIAPWLALAFVRGARGERPWRWAAVFALLVLASGSTDPPGLFYSCLLVVPIGLYLILVERSTSWRRTGGWVARAALLSLVVSAATMAQIVYGSTTLSSRLLSTESVEVVHSTTSWAESWRGLGFWPSYFREGAQALQQHQVAYFQSAPVIGATFLLPCVALATLWRSRWRPRVVMAALALTSLTLMVASFPPDSPSPLGRLLLAAYDRYPALTALRTSYKAGAGLAIGMACLVGVGVAGAMAHLSPRRPGLRSGLVGGLVLAVGVASFPFWTGRLYSAENRMRQVPSYWISAIHWLDRQPGASRALVVPGATNARYRWGSPGDDIFDALLARPHVVYTSIPLSTAAAFDLEKAIDDRVQSGRYEPGTLAPIARRLGIEYIVIRNDLDWQTLGRARPSELDAVRKDADLEAVRTFGRPGENVIDVEDRSPLARSEAGLAPVEILRVRGAPGEASGPERAIPLEPPLLVSGGGDAWPQLGAHGLLEGTTPVRYTADGDDDALGRALGGGSRVVVTDTNRRRVRAVTRFAEEESHTLAAGEELDRPADDLFERPGSQTVAAYADALTITSDTTGTSATGLEPWLRPANAFDGDETTQWLTGGLVQDPTARSVKVAFSSPVEVSAVDVLPARQTGPGRTVNAASLGFSDGTRVPLDIAADRIRTDFSPRQTTSLEVRIDAVEGPGLRPVGFAEIEVPGLDLTEVIQAPDDLFRAADHNQSLAERLSDASVTYLFERVQDDGPDDVETALRRRFRSLGRRSLDLTGRLTIGPRTPDELVDTLIGAPVGAYGTARHRDQLEHRGGLAVDGRMDTAWMAPGRPGQTVTIRFPARVVDRVDLASVLTSERSPLTRVRVRAGSSVAEVDVKPSDNCSPPPEGAGPEGCTSRAVVTLPPVRTDRISIEVTGLGPPSADSTAPSRENPVAINEVTVGPVAWAQPTDGPPSSACHEGLVAVDESPAPVRLGGSVSDLVAGRPVPYGGCAPIVLDSGWHRLSSRPAVALETAALAIQASPLPPAPEQPVPRVVVVGREASRLRLRAEVPDGGAIVVSGQSYDPHWSAAADGHDLGAPLPLDTQSGWVIPQAGTYDLDVRYRPQRVYELALALTLAGVVLCLWLVSSRTRRW